MYTSPSIVIDNGSDTTKAGFATEDLPSLVFNTNYSVGPGSDGKVIVGDDQIDQYPTNEVMTLMESGLIYDFDNIVHNWEYVYDNLDNGYKIDPKEHALTLTEQPWNTKANKLKTAELVFEQFEVPIFSLVKKPLCQLYHMGRSNGIVVDIGSSTVSVTPILDGIIQSKHSSYSKFGGDFVDANIMKFIEQTGIKYEPQDWSHATDSYRQYQISKKIIKDFKYSMLNIAEEPILKTHAIESQFQFTTKHYQLPDKQYIPIHKEQVSILESLFDPTSSPINPIQPTLEKPNTNGLPIFILSILKNIENELLTTDSNNPNKIGEILRIYTSNFLVTGDSYLLPGLSTRLFSDLNKLSTQIFPNMRFYLNQLNNFQINDVNEVWDKKYNTWLGASNLSLMINDNKAVADNFFITKQDYQEFGGDYFYENFK